MLNDQGGSDQWSSNLWGLHRNALLLASALLILSLSHNDPSPGTLSAFIVAPENVGVGLIALFAGATYAIVALVTEWLHEARPAYRKQVQELQSLRQSIFSAAENLSHETNERGEKLDSLFKNASRTLKIPRLYVPRTGDQLKTEIANSPGFKEALHATMQAWKALDELRTQPRPGNPAIPESLVNSPRMETARQGDLFTAQAKLAELLVENYWVASLGPLQIIQSSVDDLKRSYDRTIESADGLKVRVNSARKALGFEKRLFQFRALFIILLIPATLYSVALCHFVGRCGFVIADSYLYNWAVSIRAR